MSSSYQNSDGIDSSTPGVFMIGKDPNNIVIEAPIPVEHTTKIEEVASFMQEKLTKKGDASHSQKQLQIFAEQIFRGLTYSNKGILTEAVSTIEDCLTDGFNLGLPEFTDPATARTIIDDAVKLMANKLDVEAPEYHYEISSHVRRDTYISANSTKYVEALKKSDFIEKLRNNDEFKELGLDETTLLRGTTILKAIYVIMGKSGIADFIHATIHPNSGTGFLAQTLQAKPLNTVLHEVIEMATEKFNYENVVLFEATQQEKEDRFNSVEKPRQSFLQAILFEDPPQVHLKAPVVSNVVMMAAACKILETYLDIETTKDQKHGRINSTTDSNRAR